VSTAQIQLPNKLIPCFSKPRGDLRYRGAYGGRGSGKSRSFALMAAVYGYSEPLRILAAREFQVSIKQSFHAELKAAIASYPWLEAHYDVGVDYLRGANGTEFIFQGLRHNTTGIKSLSSIDLTVVEEAETISEDSWLALEATVFRQNKSELWAIWNPMIEGSPVDQRFRKSPPNNSCIVEMNWNDNPFFPAGLNELRERELKRLDPGTYAHVWEGAYLTNSDKQVFAGKYVIEEFTPTKDWNGPYFGADWGFSKDPTTLVKMWVYEDRLYIEHEAYGVGVEITETPALFDSVPGSRNHTIRADSARPETISYMKRQGFNIVAAKKGPGSVEDGIAHLRGYEKIVIHPRCKYTIQEARLYSYKTDRLSGDVLPVLVDDHNHIWDSARYGAEPLMRKTNLIMEWA
jgi:phage terminase large subunit